MAQEPSGDDTRFYACQHGIFGSQRGLVGRDQAGEREDTNPSVEGEDCSDNEPAGLDFRGAESALSLQRQGPFERGQGDTVEGIANPLTYTRN